MSDNYLDDKKKDSIINDSKKTAEEQIKVNNLEKAHQLKSHFSDSLKDSFEKDAKFEVNEDKLHINIKFQEKEQEDLIEKLVQEKLKQKEEQKMSNDSLKNNDLIKQHEKMDGSIQHVVKEEKVDVKESVPCDTTKTEVVCVEEKEKKKKCGWLWILLPLLLLILLILLIVLLARGCSDKKATPVAVVKQEKEVKNTTETGKINEQLRLEAERARLEAERIAAEKEAQAKAEAERIRLETERAIAKKEAQAKAEAERIRLEAEKLIKDKEAQLKAEAEKIRVEAEKKAQEVKIAVEEKIKEAVSPAPATRSTEKTVADDRLVKYYKASKGTYDPEADVQVLNYHLVFASTPSDPDMLYILDDGEVEVSGKVAYYDGLYQVFIGNDGTRYFLGNPDYDVYQYKILTENK